MGRALEWACGFGVFVVVTLVVNVGWDWAMEVWWVSGGTDPAKRPPTNPFVGYILGLIAAGITVKLIGKD